MVLFMARLYREGTLPDYLEAKAKRQIHVNQLKKDFGYTNSKDEFERYKIFLTQAVYHDRKRQVAEMQRNKGRTALAKAFDDLPDNVAYEQEVAWVRAHPLVFSALDKVTREEEYKPAKLTVRDLLGRSNGPAPSKGAATQLRFALADPIGWHKRLMDGGKKKAAESSGKGVEGDGSDNGHVPDDLEEVERMLRAATNG